MLVPTTLSAIWTGLIEKHQHPALRKHVYDSTVAARVAELTAKEIGSWRFIGTECAFWVVWILLNTLHIWHFPHWDLFPFPLMDLVVSFQAACTTIVVLMSTTRQEDRDRALAEFHYTETQTLHKMETENTELTQSVHKLLELNNDLTEKMSELTKEIHSIVGRERI